MTDPRTPADPTPTDSEEPGSAHPVDLAWALSQMTGLLLSRETVGTALELVTSLAAATTAAGTFGAAVTLVDEDGKRSLAASNDVVEQADALQYGLNEGPCLTAWRTQTVVRLDDTSTDDRWPRWSAQAAELGVRSALSAPMLAGDESVGAMKVYSDRPSNYGAHDEHVMRLLAAQAAIFLSNTQSLQRSRRLSRQLTGALSSRDAIAQATGVLLTRGAASQQDAFVTLAQIAGQTDRPVEDVARTLIAAVIARNSDVAELHRR